MAITHSTTIRNALADLVVDAIDAGTTNPQGQVVVGTTGFATTLATIPLDNPAFGAAAAGVATALNPPFEDSNADATGSAAEFRVEDRDSTVIFSGTVTATGGGGDMELSSIAITSGDALRINSFTYTAPA